LPELKKYIPFQKINGQKKPLIVATTIFVLASIWFVYEKKTSKKLELREGVENSLKLNEETRFKLFLNNIRNFFNKKGWQWFWDLINGRISDLSTSKQERQKELLEHIVCALTHTSSTQLEVLIETPSFSDRFFINYPDKIIDPNIKIPCGIGETTENRMENGYKNNEIDPLDPKCWITPLQYIIQRNIGSKFGSEEKFNLVNLLLSHGADPLINDHNGNNALHYALKVSNPDIKIIKLLLNARAYPDIPNKDGITCLHLLSDIKDNHSRQEIAKILVGFHRHKITKIMNAQRFDMSVRNNIDDKPLLHAVRMGRLEVVELFLAETNVNIDQVDQDGNSILLLAMTLAGTNNHLANNPWKEIVDYLLAHFEQFNVSKIIDLASNNGIKPIYTSLGYKQDEWVEKLVQHNIDIFQSSEIITENEKTKTSPLQFACNRQYKNAIIIFLEHNLIPTDFKTANDNTLAHLIINNFEENQALELLKEIKNKGFFLHEKNADDKTPLEIAFEKNYLNLVQFFLEQEDIPEDFAFSDDETLINKIAQLTNPKAEELMKLFLTKLVDEEKLKDAYNNNAFKLALECASPAANYFIQSINTPRSVIFEHRNTPAHLASSLLTGDKLIASLAEHDFPLDNQNANGQRPIEIACDYNNLTTVKALINSKKISPDTQYAENRSLAQLIMQFPDDNNVAYFLSLLKNNHFPLEVQNDQGETILHEAIQQKRKKTVAWLINNCQKLQKIPNKDNQLPLHYVARNGDKKLYIQFNAPAEEQGAVDSSGKTPYQLLQDNQSFLNKGKQLGTRLLSRLTQIVPVI
ncbi:MAG: ankyrin repeat domain-containing protein, partial [Candidatus Babeliales bacterium]